MQEKICSDCRFWDIERSYSLNDYRAHNFLKARSERYAETHPFFDGIDDEQFYDEKGKMKDADAVLREWGFDGDLWARRAILHEAACRRYPPQFLSGFGTQGKWPVVNNMAWCGEWQKVDD